MNADARMTRRLETANFLRWLAKEYSFEIQDAAWASMLGHRVGLDWNNKSGRIEFTDAPSMSPGERDDMSVATGDDWA